jgi:catechol 2,3-dioxygenase-like lactoylglutathione lyase family enzyme
MPAISDIAFVRYAIPDLDRMEQFLHDFGLHTVRKDATALYTRACGDAPFCHVAQWAEKPATLGFGLYAQSAADLAEIAREFGAFVEDSPEPGGGQRVRLTDPAGFIVDIVHGQKRPGVMEARAPVAFNAGTDRRRLGRTVRTSAEPSRVQRLGHVALLVTDLKACMAFYQRLGFRPSDSYYAGEPSNVIASFLHCGLGDAYTDHHTIAMITAPDGTNRFDHTAFEVLDLDDLMQGQAHLKARNYEHAWGVGRHIQGSQIFDYWRDPWGHKHEHWTDGDLVNRETPAGLAAMSSNELAQWAPTLDPSFFR